MESYAHPPTSRLSLQLSLYINQVAHTLEDDEGISMANLRRPSSSKDRDVVGRFRPDGHCKKHPKHRQSPGVCSLCLQEKLTRVSSSSASSSNSRNKITSAINANGSSSSSSVSSLSSYYSSASGSSCANSPLHRFQRFTAEGKSSSSSISIFFLNDKHGLSKSQSVAVYTRRRDNEGSVDINKSNKKGGFWHKLLHPKSKRMKEKDTNKLIHSRSARERLNLRVGI